MGLRVCFSFGVYSVFQPLFFSLIQIRFPQMSDSESHTIAVEAVEQPIEQPVEQSIEQPVEQPMSFFRKLISRKYYAIFLLAFVVFVLFLIYVLFVFEVPVYIL